MEEKKEEVKEEVKEEKKEDKKSSGSKLTELLNGFKEDIGSIKTQMEEFKTIVNSMSSNESIESNTNQESDEIELTEEELKELDDFFNEV